MEVKDIKTYMKSKGITQKELSLKCNIPIGTLNSIFSGRTERPRLDTMNAITEALGIDYNAPSEIYLVGGNFRTGIKNSVYIYDNSGDEYKYNLNKEQINSIIQLIETFTK